MSRTLKRMLALLLMLALPGAGVAALAEPVEAVEAEAVEAACPEEVEMDLPCGEAEPDRAEDAPLTGDAPLTEEAPPVELDDADLREVAAATMPDGLYFDEVNGWRLFLNGAFAADYTGL